MLKGTYESGIDLFNLICYMIDYLYSVRCITVRMVEE